MNEALSKWSRVSFALVFLSLVPTVGGLIRLSRISSGSLEPADLRFATDPAPIALHIVASLVYCLIGAFQFDEVFRRRAPLWHRRAGFLTAGSGLLSAFSGLAMTLRYDIPAALQGPLTFGARLLVGAAMALSLVLGLVLAARRNIRGHRAFMIRAYALGQGAGTQVFLLGLPAAFTGHDITGALRDWLMAASWLLNALLAELIIRRKSAFHEPDPASRSSSRPSFRSSHGTLFGLGLTMLLASLSTSIVTIALPSLAREFSISFGDVQWVLLAHLLTVTTFMVSAGKLGDLLGRRRLLLGGIALFSAAALLAALAPSFPLLLAARALQGLGAAVMMAQSLALVSMSVEKERTGRALGLLGSMSAIGTALGPALGGFLTENLGVRAVFSSQVPLAALAFFFVIRFVASSNAHATRAASFDRIGTLLLGLAVFSYALAMTRGSREFLPTGLSLLTLAALACALFVRAELRSAAPLVELKKLASPTIGRGLTTSALVSTLIMTTLVVGPFYLSGALGLGPSAVGFVLAVGPGVAALMGYPAGRLVDRYGASRMTRFSLGALVLGSGGLAAVSLRSGIAGYVAPLAVVTGGYALFQTANNTGVMGSVTPEERGVVSGLLNLSRNIGLITGASLMSAVFAFAAGAPDAALAAPETLARATRVTYALGAALALLSFGLALGTRKRASQPDLAPPPEAQATPLSRAIASSALRSGSSRLLR